MRENGVGGYFFGSRFDLEIPGTVEALKPGRLLTGTVLGSFGCGKGNKRGAGLEFVQSDQLWIFPRRLTGDLEQGEKRLI